MYQFVRTGVSQFLRAKSRRAPRSRGRRKGLPSRDRGFFEYLEERRVLAAGMLDPTFGVGGQVTTNFDSNVPSYDIGEDVVAYQSDGKFVAAGSSEGRMVVSRYNVDGSLDDTFGTGGKAIFDPSGFVSQTRSVAVDSKDRILVGGIGLSFATPGASVARLTASGGLDVSFSNDGFEGIFFGDSPSKDVVTGVAVDALDRVILSGFRETSTNADFAVARFTELGIRDFSFSGGLRLIDFGANDFANGVAVDKLNRVILGGYSIQPGTGADFAVARLTDSGELDLAFSGDGKQTIDFGNTQDFAEDVAVDLGNRVVLGGRSTQPGTGSDFAVARLTDSGELDLSFSGDGKETIDFGNNSDIANGIAIDSLDRVVLGGHSQPADHDADFAVARLTVSGQLDLSFGSGKRLIDFSHTNDFANGVAVDELNRVILGGYSNGSVTASDFAVARLTELGEIDLTFSDDGRATLEISRGSRDFAFGVATYQSDGKIVVVGTSERKMAVARYNANGSLDATFGQGGKVRIEFDNGADAFGVAVDSLDRILIGGRASGSDFAVARLTASGELDASFSGDGKQTIDFGNKSDVALDVAVDSLNRVILAGQSSSGAVSDFAVARLTEAGEVDISFSKLGQGRQTIDFGSDKDFANSVTVDSLDRIIVGGSTFYFGSPTVASDFAVARLTNFGELDLSFSSDGKQTIDFGNTQDSANDVAVDALDRVVLAGSAVARLTDAGELDVSFSGDGRQTIGFGVSDIAFDLLNRIVLAGNTGGNFAVARLSSDGSLDLLFDTDGKQTIDFGSSDQASGVAIQPNGKIVVVGSTGATSASTDFAITRLEDNLSVIGTAGDDIINISAGTQAGTLKATVNGLVTDNILVDAVTGLGGNDAITVTAALSGGLALSGQDGSDTYDISFGGLAGTVTVLDDGAAGIDSLTVRGTPGDDNIFKDATKVTLGSPVVETVLSSGIETRQIRGGGGNDLITDPGSDTAIFGEGGNDTIVINATFGTGVSADGGEGSDIYQIVAGQLAGPIAIADSGTSGNDSVRVVGTPGADTFVQTSTGLVLNGTVITFSSGLESATVDGGGGSDQVSYQSASPVPISVTDMVVTGTSGNDLIAINPGTVPGQVVARLNGTIVAQFIPTSRIVVSGGAGNDAIIVDPRISLPAWLYGGAGNDLLTGGAGNDVLLGGDGADALADLGGRNILIGGAGSDALTGALAEDLLIAGTTSHDTNATALAAVMAEWTSSRSYENRVSNIRGVASGATFGLRLNGSYFLNVEASRGTVTVHDDLAIDLLTGLGGRDWFFADLDNAQFSKRDLLLAAASNELRDDVD